MIKTMLFRRKTFTVNAVKVSEANMAEVAEWSGGSVETDASGHKHIRIESYNPMNERQTRAYVGDWVLGSENGYKVYTPKAFDKSFEKVKTMSKEEADAAGIKVPHEKSQRPKPSGPRPQPPKNAGKPQQKGRRRNNRKPQKPAHVGDVGKALQDAQSKQGIDLTRKG